MEKDRRPEGKTDAQKAPTHQTGVTRFPAGGGKKKTFDGKKEGRGPERTKNQLGRFTKRDRKSRKLHKEKKNSRGDKTPHHEPTVLLGGDVEKKIKSWGVSFIRPKGWGLVGPKGRKGKFPSPGNKPQGSKALTEEARSTKQTKHPPQNPL